MAVCCAASIWPMLSAVRHAEAAKPRAAVLNILAEKCWSEDASNLTMMADVSALTNRCRNCRVGSLSRVLPLRGLVPMRITVDVNREGRAQPTSTPKVRSTPTPDQTLHSDKAATMPGRTASRSTRTSTASTTRKASSTRASSARQSSNAVEIPDEGPITSLRTQVAQVFGDAQKTTATQRKLVVNLRKIQEACCFEPPETNKKGGKKAKGELQEDFDEEEFNSEVVRCVLRILAVKKSEPVGDRVIRFLGVFLKHASEKGMRQYSGKRDPGTNSFQIKPSLQAKLRKKPLLSTRHPAAA
jgi:hypothetical protein